MEIQRRFTRKGESPYYGISFETRTSEIRNPDGRVIFRAENVVVPSSWSQIATDILAQKYFRKRGVPVEPSASDKAGDGQPDSGKKDGGKSEGAKSESAKTDGGKTEASRTGSETDARQVFHRLAHTWTDWGRRYGYFNSESDAQSFYDELCFMLAHQMGAPNSPQWFNTGLFSVYGITGPSQGHYFVNPKTGQVEKATSAYERPQPHACQPFHAPVSTPQGPVAIGSIVKEPLIGLEVYDGTQNGRGTTRVIAVAENGVKPVFKVVLKNGTVVEATGDHLVLASTERRGEGRWVPVEQLGAGTRLHLSTATEVVAERQGRSQATDEAALVGWLRGDGFVGRYQAAANRILTEELALVGRRSPAAPALREEAVVRLEFGGLQRVYDIQTESGQYLSNNVIVHNCFILSVQDDLVNEGGIMDLMTREARLFKYGSGTGTNYSRLRGSNEPLSGGGASSGLLSFLKVSDRSASSIKSGGTTRRAARMVTLDANHPDVMRYIDWKAQEERKVAALVAGSKVLRRHTRRILQACRPREGDGGNSFDPKANRELGEALRAALADEVPASYLLEVVQLAAQGVWEFEPEEYSTDWEGEAYNTVSGQSSNNSVRVTDAFMKAVLDDGWWELTGRIDGKARQKVRAREIWDRVALAAWLCADPGLQFHTTINDWHTCPKDGEIRASNPCVTGDTLVATDKGYRRIDGLVGRSATIVDGDGDLVQIDGAFKTGTRPVFELKTASGYRLRLTGDHLVKTANRGDVPARELTAEDSVILESPGFGDASLPEAFATVLGAALGDGCITRGHSQDHARLADYAVLDEGSERKAFTDAVYSLDRASIAGVLRGLFTTDGTVANNGKKSHYVALDSTSLELLRQVQLLLLAFGIKAKLCEDRRAIGLDTEIFPDGHGGSREYRIRQVHSLRISRSSRMIFERSIGFLQSSCKARKLAELNAELATCHDLPTDRFASLTPCGVEDVYDLTEPRGHHFVANGIVVHNCSEYMFLDDTACNLASLNLLAFYDKENGQVRIDELRHAIRLWTIVLEVSVLMAQYPSEAIARRSYDYRTLGLGFANLGSLLMVMGVPYDSAEGRAIAAALTAIITGEAYAASSEMAAELGPSPRFASNRDDMLRVIRNHRRAAWSAPAADYEKLSVLPQAIDPLFCPPELLAAAHSAWDRALELGEKHGYRNAQVSAIAPTGTIGLVMDCDTTGIEPDFSLVKFKKLAGGGYFKIINSSLPPALKHLGYSQAQINDIVAYCLGRGTLEGAPGVSAEALRAKGFTDEELAKVNGAVRNAFSVTFAFTPHVLGKDFLSATLRLPESAFSKPDFNLLAHLGFSREEVEQADRYACGTMTIEGAPHLAPEHYPVFDTASPNGRLGKRAIPWRAHIEMMASVQPFVSGAISKTINMPASTTIDEIKGAYLVSWKKMLKAIALYRDGSKLSQPLSSLMPAAGGGASAVLAALQAVTEGEVEGVGVELAAGARPKKRNPLPAKRFGYTQKAKIGGHSIFLRTGQYEDGTLGEIFLDMHKEGAAFRSLLNSFAIAVSLGLQYGVPLEEYVDAFTFTRFEPNGIVSGHDNIKMTTSVLDFIFRDLALSYLGRTDLVQVKPDDLIATSTMPNGERTAAAGNGNGYLAETDSQVARMKGYEGDPCPVCGNFTLARSGTCLRCDTCGSTTGCS